MRSTYDFPSTKWSRSQGAMSASHSSSWPSSSNSSRQRGAESLWCWPQWTHTSKLACIDSVVTVSPQPSQSGRPPRRACVARSRRGSGPCAPASRPCVLREGGASSCVYGSVFAVRIGARSAATFSVGSVGSCTSRALTPGATSRSTSPSWVTSIVRQVGDDAVHDPSAREGQVALAQDLAALPSLAACSMMTTTRLARATRSIAAAHALDHLAGDHPVCEVAAARSPAWRRGSRGRCDRRGSCAKLSALEKIGAARQHRHGLLAGVDEVGVELAPRLGVGADAEQAVLALQDDLDAGGDVVGASVGMPMPEVDVEAVAQLLRGALARSARASRLGRSLTMLT